MPNYSHQVLRGTMRGYVIGKIKKPLTKAITILGDRYPDPKREDCIHPNTHILLDIRDRFLECETNAGRRALFEATWKILIAEYDHDPYYRYRLDWVFEQIMDRDWLTR